MADTKLADLSSGAPAAGTDIIYAVKDPGGTPLDRKLALSEVKDYILSLANTWTATQTITPAANTNALAVTGYSLTGSNAQSLIDLAGTWNTTGTPSAIKLNITNTASNAASLLMDVQVGGASFFSLAPNGNLRIGPHDTAFSNSGLIAKGLIVGRAALPANVAGDQINLAVAAGNVISMVATQGVNLASTLYLGWSSGSTTAGTDTYLYRDAANTLAQRNGTNPQTFRAYFSYTDGSNYTRLALKTATGIHTVETESAGTGEANIDLALTPKGTGRVRYGTHSAIAAETVTGYITIKDSGGTERKLAVVS